MSAPNDDISLEDILGQLSTFESEVPVAKNSENTVDTSIVPIVVVPGVMGSKLKFSDGATWDPDSQATMLLDWISFATRAVYSRFKGASATVTGDTGLLGDRGVGELVAKFYLNFLTFLSATFSPISGAFCPVHAVGYNWTQSCAKSAERLDQRLQEILKQWGAKKAVIVTHSMGGLVARAACQRPGFADRVAGIVHTVQPALGASVAYRQFLTGSTSVSKDKSIAERAFDMLAGDEWWKYMAYMSVLGGPVELLPNDTYRLTASNGAWLQHLRGDHTTGGETVVPVNTLFTLATYLTNQFPGVVFDYDGSVASGAAGGFFGFEWVDIQTNLRINLANGRLFHTRLGLSSHPTTSVLASTESSTTEAGVIGTTFETAPFFKFKTVTSEGDFTVPRFSAEAIKPCENGVIIADPAAAKPPRLLVGPVGEHKAVLDNDKARAFIVDNIRYLVQKAKSP